MGRTMLLAVAAAIVAGGSAQAHHAYALYVEDRTVWIEGELAQFVYGSPHTIVTLKTAGSATTAPSGGIDVSSPVTESPRTRSGSAIASSSPAVRAETDDRILHVKGVRRIADGWRWPAS